jgi:hypothetical protein
MSVLEKYSSSGGGGTYLPLSFAWQKHEQEKIKTGENMKESGQIKG